MEATLTFYEWVESFIVESETHRTNGKGQKLHALTRDVNFKRAGNMGEILQAALDFVRRNYQNHSPFAR